MSAINFRNEVPRNVLQRRVSVVNWHVALTDERWIGKKNPGRSPGFLTNTVDDLRYFFCVYSIFETGR
jgi:6-phosphogluconolactonase/glucosamine-6-phosphate isomerase/deaminase